LLKNTKSAIKTTPNPILKDEGGRMMMKKNFILHPPSFILKERGNKSSHHQIPQA
jgi:hypothetical protein